ncbi:MAG: leucine-rich repeat domain-containing protein [Chloroflexota bacterium]
MAESLLEPTNGRSRRHRPTLPVAKAFLQGVGLESTPEWLSKLTQLKELSISNNQIKTVPTWIANLTHLEILYCHHNLTDLPPLLPNLSI